MEFMEQLSGCTGNVKQLTIRYSDNCIDCLTPEILSRWKLCIPPSLVFVIAQTCSQLTSIKLKSDHINDSAVIAIADRVLIDLAYIPIIPTDDIARRCSHALCAIHYLDINNFHCRHDIKVVISYMTGLTSVRLDYY